MIRRPPRSTRTDTLGPYTRSAYLKFADHHRPLSRSHHGLWLFGRFDPQFGERCRVHGPRLPRGEPDALVGDGRDRDHVRTVHAMDDPRQSDAQCADAGRAGRGGEGMAVGVTAWLPPPRWGRQRRSEEHTSELQSLMRISYAVFCLKKKKH